MHYVDSLQDVMHNARRVMPGQVIVVGAGMGGLACALDLAASGCRVRVLERGSMPGGKAAGVHIGGVAMDGGPTVVTMPWFFEELFDAAGTSLPACAHLEPVSVLARHAWADGTRLDLHAAPAQREAAIGDAFGAAEARACRAFYEDGRRIYETVLAPFLRAQRPTLLGAAGMLGDVGFGALRRIDAFRTMWGALERRFSHPHLRQLFGRYATYCGSSPFDAPATLNLIAFVESQGVYRVQGGVRALCRAVEKEARRLGVEFDYEADVTRVATRGGRCVGAFVGAELREADAVVWNGDVAALGAGLAGPGASRAAPTTPASARSLSATTWSMIARTGGFSLAHHNVFFSRHYAAEFEAVFGRGEAPPEPTVYVCAQDRGDAIVAPADERLLVLVNAPPNGDEPGRWNEAERIKCEGAMRRTLEGSGLTIEPSETICSTPADYERRFPGTGGGLYGPRAKGAMSAFARAPSWTKLPGLYLAGGSVHPGPGLPMAALSGRLAAARIRQDFASIARSRRAGISGTTSTE
jgi:1-hydroxycarotenoid 3,4-desaturase